MNQTKYLKLALVLFVISGLAVFSSNNSKDNSNKDQIRDVSNIKRKTELGIAKVSKKKLKTDFDLKFLDPALKQKWGLEMTSAMKAWKKHKLIGSKNIVIAVIDTGIDVNHPDLKANLWVNKKEIPNNNIDDDKNGFVDDYHGFNFVANNHDLSDNHGHGTHIAGIVGAVGGNGIGISGVAPRVSLMTLKYYDPKSTGGNNLTNTIRAIRYATMMKKKYNLQMIINYSGGGIQVSHQEKAAVKEANAAGILFVAAAGNEHSNTDVQGYYPADYPFKNIISVTAVNKQKNVLQSSNYGINTVDVAAPGNNIYSTLPNGKYGYMTGTSQATAFVTGVAALIMTQFKDFSPEQVIDHITQTGDLDKKLIGKTRYRKRLNTYRALSILDQGVTASGAIVRNTSSMKAISLEDPNLQDHGKDVNSVNDFGKSMSELLQAIPQPRRQTKRLRKSLTKGPASVAPNTTEDESKNVELKE